MNRVSFAKYHWADEENKIVHVTETINGVGRLTAHVNLESDAVEIINTEFVEPSHNVTPNDFSRILQDARDWERRQRPPFPKDIKWHEDGMKFETQRESWEWVSSVVYNEIGNHYDGYRTEDEKIAYSLVYELTRLNTFSGKTFEVYAHEYYINPEIPTVYLVWVKRTNV